MINISLSQNLARQNADNKCLLYGDKTITTGDLLDMSATFKRTSGLPKGCRVALSGLNPLDLIVALVALDGYAISMLLLPASVCNEHALSLIIDASCDYLVSSDNCQQRAFSQHKSLPDTVETRWLLATSGTTGFPKLINHNFRTLTRTVKNTYSPGYKWGLVYDPNRFAGLQVVLQALLSGSQLSVPLENKFEQQLESIVQHKVTALSATPSLWRKLLMDRRTTDLALKQVTLGGEVTDQTVINALKNTFPSARVVHIYASTEVGVGFTVQDGQAGFPASWLETPPSTVPPLRISEENHLLIKLAMVTSGTEVISRMDADGYFDTEDLVRQESSRIYFLGRASGAINVGGNKVNPEEVEAFLRTVDGVRDARVFAKKSSLLGQLVAAEIVLDPTVCAEALKQNIRQRCREHLKSWQVPAMLKLVEALKESTAGKRLRLIE